MIDNLLLILPLYALIVLGFGIVKSGYFPGEHMGAVSQFVVRVSLPVLIFAAVVKGASGGGMNPLFILAYAIGSLISMAVLFAVMRLWLKQPPNQAMIMTLGAGVSNTSFLGIPISSAVFGDAAAPVVASILIVENLVVLPIALIASDYLYSHGSGIVSAVKQIGHGLITNPLVIALALGLTVAGLGVHIPTPLQTSITMLAAMAPGAALVIVGGTIAMYEVHGVWRRVSVLTVVKLVVHPLAASLTLALMPGIDPEIRRIGIVFAALPMMTIFPILARRHGAEMPAASAVVVATALSFITVSAVIWFVTH
ncbi:AEC family transporter [Pseudooceanicola nanhaiensis]|uniref:AEC family transporter n=1 Tax=Pseudooceanicola nanhaiensis TaxID=375761 RepID=UPI001CD4781B|nr:AEC family transporter [Pseudooceanicola nanhaiensis]MCA0919194.1 AEC family transporter [Pseudooceanicola nanhaiensis]